MTPKAMIRRIPGVSKVLGIVGYEGWRHCRGVYATFDQAKAAISASRAVGFDNRESARLYLHELDRTKPSDYAVLFWMKPLLPEIRSVFDYGGNKGWSFYSFQKYLRFAPGLRWTICDVPEVVSLGREVALARGARNLEFTSDFSEVEGCDLLFTSGALQFVDRELSELLACLESRPPTS